MDWVAFGLPTEGTRAATPRVTSAMRSDVPTCGLHDRVGEVQRVVRGLDWEICVMVDEERVVLGLLHSDAWNAPPDTPVEQVMSNGPPTTRPGTFLDEMVERLRRRNTPGILISDSDGVLMGYLWKADAERALEAISRERDWADRDCSPSEAG